MHCSPCQRTSDLSESIRNIVPLAKVHAFPCRLETCNALPTKALVEGRDPRRLVDFLLFI